MQPKTYAMMFVAAAATMFVGIAAANLLIDPQGVFETRLLPPSPNANTRFSYFAAYRKASTEYEGLMFGSSRANVGISVDDLGRRTGMKFANFAVVLGRLEDHILVLEFAIREKRLNRAPFGTVFLLLDVDRLGDSPLASRDLLLPPELTGGDPMRFWWRNLTAIQWGLWRLDIVRAWQRAWGIKSSHSTVEPVSMAALSSAWLPNAARAQAIAPAQKARTNPIVGTWHFTHQMKLLTQFASLCRQHDIELIVALSPISRSDMAGVDEQDLARAVDLISRVVPAWDFTQELWLSNHPELWVDASHYRTEVGHKMLARIFGDPIGAPWEDFGRLRGAPASQ